MHNRFKIFISIVVVAMFLGTGLASERGTAYSVSNSSAAEALSPAMGEVVNTWSLSGKTCAPSSASSESTVALKIDVTSFSESSGAGPTVMYFVVNGKKIHSTDVDGTILGNLSHDIIEFSCIRCVLITYFIHKYLFLTRST